MFLAEAHWQVTDWSDCRPLSAESQCGFGSQTRNLTCVFFPSWPRLETEPSRCNEVRVEHSHLSRSLQIMIIVETCYTGAKVSAITIHLNSSKVSPTRDILCLSVCCYNVISGFHAQKGSIIMP